MKKGLLVIIAIAAILFFWFKGAYNGMVSQDVNVKTAWAQVQNQYQRRMDLVNNLVSTVKGEAKFESSTLENVIKARASATQIKVDANDLTPEKLKQFQESQGQLSQALGRLMVVSEQYPTLRANDGFRNLQTQLEGTENRIATARMDFNNAVQSYNLKVRTFPNNIFAGMFGFKEKPAFEADAAAQKAPQVNFDN